MCHVEDHALLIMKVSMTRLFFQDSFLSADPTSLLQTLSVCLFFFQGYGEGGGGIRVVQSPIPEYVLC